MQLFSSMLEIPATARLRGQWLAFAVLTLALAGCTDRSAPDAAAGPPGSTGTAPDPATDEWLGQWNGPEGTFLRLQGGRGTYEITIQDLDGPRTYRGTAAGDRIQFDRNGTTESIRATNGADTGMKWLQDKSRCLTIRYGEGYCRD